VFSCLDGWIPKFLNIQLFRHRPKSPLHVDAFSANGSDPHGVHDSIPNWQGGTVHRERLTKHTISGDIESRQDTAFIPNPPLPESLSTQDASGREWQEFYSAMRFHALL
jgi:hypothetical protein